MKDQIAESYTKHMQGKHAWKVKRADQAVVTGSNGKDNIGSAVADVLDDHGYDVLQPDTEYDLGNPHGLDELYAKYGEFINNSDTLVMCQGYIYMDWLEEQPEHEVEGIVLSNLLSVALVTRRFVQSTIDNSYRKRIVAIGSMSYRNVLNGSAVYGAAKAGVAHYIRCAAWELAPKGYRVFALHPGNVQGTPMSRKVIEHIASYRGLSHKEAVDYWHAVEPTDETMDAFDVAQAVRWLVNGDFDHMTGASIDMSMGVR